MKFRYLLFLLSLTAGAQGVRFDSQAWTAATNVPIGAQAPIYTVPYATVNICTDPSCATPVPLFSNVGLTTPLVQPLKADAQGRYGFWAAAGTYWYKACSPKNVCMQGYITLGGSGAGATFQTNTVNNASQTLLDLDQGTNVTLTNTSGGHVRIDAAGGSGSGCNPGVAATDVLTSNGTGGCTGDANFTYATGTAVLGGASGGQLNIDNKNNISTNYMQMDGQRFIWYGDGAGLDTGAGLLPGMEMHFSDKAVNTSHPGPLGIYMTLDEWNPKGATGIEIDPDCKLAGCTSLTGVLIAMNTTHPAAKVYSFQGTAQDTLTGVTEQSPFFAQTQTSSVVVPSYCDFIAHDAAATPAQRVRLGCGSGATSDFYGNTTIHANLTVTGTCTGCGGGSTLALTTTGAGGPATYTSGTLNVPLYANSTVPHLAGMSMFLDMLPAHISGGVVQDQSGSGNNGTFGTTAPTVGATGIVLNGASSVSLPAALNSTRTFEFAVKIDAFAFSGGYSSYFGPAAAVNGPNALESYGLHDQPSLELFDRASGPTTGTATYLSAGVHDIIITLGQNAPSNTDHFYFDGVEVGGYYAQVASAGTLASSNYVIGAASFGNGFQGTMYEFITRSVPLSASDVALEHQAIQSDIALRGGAAYGPPWNNTGPNQISVGDSITACYGATGGHCWVTAGVLDATVPAFTITNLGNPGKTSQQVNYALAQIGPAYCKSNSGPNIATIMDGTNDFAVYNSSAGVTGVSVAATLANQVQVLKEAGCRVFVGTMISRGDGQGTTSNGFTWAQNKNALNAQIRSQALTIWGAAGILDFAASSLGPDTANTDTTLFQDTVHPTNAGYDLMTAVKVNAVNYAFGHSRANPNQVSAATYTMAAGDGYIEATITANATWTLPSCIGQSGAAYTINNPTAFSITLKSAASTQPINGVDRSVTGFTVPTPSYTLYDVPNPGSNAGCHWSN